ncbi:MAG: PAS domain S-box protein [Verrucomicrobiia bacterium]|jgi:PAS domain S-box-containing protein
MSLLFETASQPPSTPASLQPKSNTATGARDDELAVQRLDGQAATKVYATLFDAYCDGIILIDVESGMILDTNATLQELIQCPKGATIGQHYTELHPAGEARKYKKLFEEATRSVGVIEPFETTVIAADQGLVPVEISACIVELGDGKRLVQSTVRDISGRKRTEEALISFKRRSRP